MQTKLYIQVILPLKLDWMPWYYTDGISVAVGDRVSLRFAGRRYSAVVAAVSGTPGIDVGRVLPIDRVESGLERISGQEIELWKFMADYYMCSVGEVFKLAYPMSRIEKEQAALRVQQRQRERKIRESQAVQARLERILARLEKCRTSLLSPHNETVTQRLKATELSLETSLASLQARLDSLRGELSEDLSPDGQSSRPELSENLLPSAESSRPEHSENLPPSAESSRPASRPSNPVAEQDWPQAGKMLRMMEEGGKTVLAVTAGQSGLWPDAVRRQLERGRNVLVLEAEIGAAGQLHRALADEFGERLLLYHSSIAQGRRRDVEDRLRSGKSYLVVGTRSALLLPFASLGLIVVLNEHDPAYKQDVTPRYHGRDLAAVLARIHGCGLLLCSATPSLESIANVLSGKYLMLPGAGSFVFPPAEIIDTAAEKRKRGMVGNISRRLIGRMAQELSSGGKVLLLRTWGDVHFLRDEVVKLFPQQSVSCLGDEDYRSEAQIILGTMSRAKALELSGIALVAVMLCDDLFARADFRSDERALQILRQLQLRRSEGAGSVSRTGRGGNIVIQTSRSSHPVYRMLSSSSSSSTSFSTSPSSSSSSSFSFPSSSSSSSSTDGGSFSYEEVMKQLLQERKVLNLPPYSRIVDVLIRDASPSRLNLMSSRLAQSLREVCGGAAGSSSVPVGGRDAGLSPAPGAGGAAGSSLPQGSCGAARISPVRGAGGAGCPASESYVRFEGVITEPFNAAPWESDLLRIRIVLPKGQGIAEAKRTILAAVAAFEKKNSYTSHIHFDVDPV